MRHKSQSILAFGFGSLLALIGALVYGAIQRADEIYAEASMLQQSFQRRDDLLNEIRSELYRSETLLRDFLLDASVSDANPMREELLAVRATITDRIDQLESEGPSEQLQGIRDLDSEIEHYWDAFDPVLDWTPAERVALSADFLQREVLPRRAAVLTIAGEIRELDRANLDHERQRSFLSQQGFGRYLRATGGVALLLGVFVAAGSIWRISTLERKGEEQLRQTENTARELRQLSQQLARAQEEERRSLSRELHDEIGQTLTALSLQLDNLEQLTSPEDTEYRQHLDDSRLLTLHTLDVVRNLAMGLRPSMLDDFGLAPTLGWYARDFTRRSGILVDVHVEDDIDGIPDAYQTSVFRVVQEALTNCARHSEAKCIRIVLERRRAAVSLTIQDDGVGFDPASVKKGLGLVGIEERIGELGGKVAIYSQVYKGTLVQAEIPLSHEVSV